MFSTAARVGGVLIDQLAGDGIESIDIEVAGDGGVILALCWRVMVEVMMLEWLMTMTMERPRQRLANFLPFRPATND